MCGIVGILGKSAVSTNLVDALRRLEYRGYDSAGIATVEAGTLERRRAEGKLRNLEKRLLVEPLAGRTGIGHTRWATHGRPTERNAHPHMTAQVSVVHNGIIENFRDLRAKLEARGHRFQTDTDTEAVVHLISDEMDRGAAPIAAVREALKQLQGAFALGIIFAGHDDLMIAARKGSPLAIGHGTGEMYLGSDAIALAPFTDAITYLEEGDWAVLRRSGAEIYDCDGARVERPIIKAVASSLLVDKGNYRHFMAKEIHEQPEVISHTLANYLDMVSARVNFPDLGIDLAKISRVTISACGTAYYAGLVAKYWIERFARVAVDIDVASEMRYRETPLPEGGLAVFVSQSGETADTLATLRYCKANGQRIASIVNVRTSTIAREVARSPSDARRTRNRRRVDQGIYLPALGSRLLGDRHRPGSRPDDRRAGVVVRQSADRNTAPRCLDPASRRTLHRRRSGVGQGSRRSLSRARIELPDRSRGRAEAQGNLLHPCRRLCCR